MKNKAIKKLIVDCINGIEIKHTASNEVLYATILSKIGEYRWLKA